MNYQDLILDNNQLTTVPESIGNLNSLEALYLNDNQLTSIPESICNYSYCYFNVSNNYLCEEYHYDCIDNWGTQDQSNCSEGEDGQENWTECE